MGGKPNGLVCCIQSLDCEASVQMVSHRLHRLISARPSVTMFALPAWQASLSVTAVVPAAYLILLTGARRCCQDPGWVRTL
jgi:hypothetical protein